MPDGLRPSLVKKISTCSCEIRRSVAECTLRYMALPADELRTLTPERSNNHVPLRTLENPSISVAVQLHWKLPRNSIKTHCQQRLFEISVKPL